MRYVLMIGVALALVVVPIGAGALATTEPEIEMEDFSFRPARMAVGPGALVIWKNRDRAPHNAVAVSRAAGKPLFRTRTTGFRGEVTARAPRRLGTFAYICTVHPRMRGTLVVRR